MSARSQTLLCSSTVYCACAASGTKPQQTSNGAMDAEPRDIEGFAGPEKAQWYSRAAHATTAQRQRLVSEIPAVPLNATTIIARNSLFRGLPEQTIAQITALASRRSYKADALIFMRGDPGDALYGVVTGRVRISASGAGGKEVFLNIMEPGDAFGEIALLDGQARTAAATTLAPTELLIIRREDFLALVKREPQLAVHLIELLCKRVRWTSEQSEASSLLNVAGRLAKRLLSLASSHARKTPAGVQLKITQEDLAQFLGLSRQIVNKYLQTWKKQGWITLGRGSVTLVDERALRELTRKD
jgi:CRP/FNR family cyclic AMP-dependent transcriptional regulator